MRDFITDKGSFTNIKISDIDKVDGNENSVIWTTEKIDKILDDYKEGVIDIRGYKGTPFLSNDINMRRPKLIYQYTKEEMEELRKCAADPIYFGERYAKVMTDNGIIQIKFRDYQLEVTEGFLKNKYSILMASRQVGKCHSLITRLLCYDNQTNSLTEIPFFELYFNELKRTRKLKPIEKIKYKLYRLYYLLSESR